MLKKLTAYSLVLLQVSTPVFAAQGDFIYRYGPGVLKYTSTGEEQIPLRSLSAIEGNVGGSSISSQSPTAILQSIANHLKGGAAAVVFDGIEPPVPGLSFNASTGQVSGVPTAEYNGTSAISYHDGENRPGKLSLPVSIYPYPTLVSSGSAYDLPQQAHAADYDIKVSPGNGGFYKGVVYSLAPTSDALPSGLSLSDNMIIGSTTASAGVYNIVIRATSVADPSVFVDKAFSVKVTAPSDMSLDLKPDAPLVWKFDEATAKVVEQQKFEPSPAPKGSYTAPIKWSLIDAPAWMGIDASGQLTGTPPARGSYNLTVQAKDAEQHTASDTVAVKVTIPGYIYLAPGAQIIHVRTNETFATAAQTPSNYVGAYTYHPSGTPSDVTFDQTSGVFSGTFAEVANNIWHLYISDEDGRTDAGGAESNTNYLMSVETHGPVTLAAATSASGGAQDTSDAPFSIQWPQPANILGKAAYTVNGAVPGTLYYKVYDQNNASGLATYTDAAGSSTVRQGAGETTAQVEARLPADHIVFDTLALSLTGVPSRAGTFTVSLSVADDHEETGYTLNPYEITRATSNSAVSPDTTVTTTGRSILAVNVYGDTEALSQFTSQPKNGIALRDSLTNVAYKGGAVWTLVSGALPPGVTSVVSAEQDVLSFAGYPTTQGTYGNLVWKVTVPGGAQFNTKPLTFTVGPRLDLAFDAPQSAAINVRAVTQPVNQTVSVINTPNGEILPAASWTVTGLPDGVDYAIDKNVLTLSGAAQHTGSYTVTITAVDSKGGSATKSLPITVTTPFISYTNGGDSSTIAQYTEQASKSTIIRDGGSNDTYAKALTWTLYSGTLPPGVTTSFSYGGAQVNYAGYPTALGTYGNIVWKVADAQGNFLLTPAVTFTVVDRNALTLTATPSTVVSGTVGNPLSVVVTPSGTPYGEKIASWTVPAGFPAGVTFANNNGVATLSGTPTQTGTYPVTLKATDSLGGSGTVMLTFKVGIGLISANNGGNTETIQQYTGTPTLSTAIRVAASNETYTDGATFAVSSGTLPPGISISASADGSGYYYTGYPTTQGTYSNIVVAVTDPYGNVFYTTPVTFVVGPRDALKLSANTGNTRQMILSTDDALVTVSAQNTPSNEGISVGNWTVTGTLPPGVTTSQLADGLHFNGKASAAGTYNVTVTAVDSKGMSAVYPITFNVTATGLFKLTNSVATQTLAQYGSVQANIVISSRLTANNALYPITSWNLVAGKLPTGIKATPSADGSTLNFSGYPAVTGTFGGIVYVATDANGNQANSTAVSFTVTARATALAVTTTPTNGIQTLPSGKTAASTTVTVKNIPMNGTTNDITWSVTGKVPEGITWSVVSGVVKFAGISTAPGDYYPKVTATDVTGQKATANLTFSITSTYGTIGGFTDSTNFANVVCYGDCYYSDRIETLALGVTTPTSLWSIRDGGNSAYAVTSFSVKSGSLPPGVTAVLNAAKNALMFTGKPTTAGTYSIQYYLTDKNAVKVQIPAITFIVQ
jgi:hypothetical protein